MLNIITKAGKGISNKAGRMKRYVAALSVTGGASLYMALPMFAASDLDTVTTELVDGAGSMKTNAMTIISVVIGIFVVIFGIGWLMGIFKKKMNKAG